MPEGQEALETLIVRIEADLRELLTGAEQGVEETTKILRKIPPTKLELDTKAAEAGFDKLTEKAREWDRELIEIEKAQEARWKQMRLPEPTAAIRGRVFEEPTIEARTFLLPGAERALTRVEKLKAAFSGFWDNIRSGASSAWDSIAKVVSGTQQLQEAGTAAALGVGKVFDAVVKGAGVARGKLPRMVSEVMEVSVATGASFDEIISKSVEVGNITTQQAERIREALQKIQAAPGPVGTEIKRVGADFNAASMEVEKFFEVVEKGSARGATDVERWSGQIVRMSAQTGTSFQTLVNGFQQTGHMSSQVAKSVMQSLQQAGGAVGKFSGFITSLGAVGKYVFGTLFGVTVIRILRKFMRWIKEAAKSAIAFEFSLVRLSVAIRAVQRQIGENAGTMDSWQATIAELNQMFPALSKVALTEAAGATLLLTRELQFNEEQMQKTLKAAALMASMWGIDMMDALKLLTQGLTGIARGLRIYGTFISRVQLQDEALRMGITKTWNEMNAGERALVALNIVLRQTDPLLADIGALLDTAQGRMAIFKAETKDATAEIGKMFAPALEQINGLIAWLAKGLATASKTFLQMMTLLSAGIKLLGTFNRGMAAGASLTEAAERAWAAYDAELLRAAERFNLLKIDLGDVSDEAKELGENWEEVFGEDFLDLLMEAGDEIADLILKGEEAVADALRELDSDLKELARDLARDYADAFEDLTDELADLERDSLRERAEAYETYLERLADLDVDYGRKREDILEDEAYRLSQLDEDLSDAQAEARRDYNQKLEQLERNHLRKMRQLRERFIEDMSEVIARRDAWGAVKLIRRYNRERREAEQNLEDQRTDAAAALADRLDDLVRSNARRRKKIIEDTKRRLKDLELWLRRQRDEILEGYEEELEDIAVQQARKQRDLKEAYAEQLVDLEIAHREAEQERIGAYNTELINLHRQQNRKFTQIARGLATETELTRAGARAILVELLRVFGAGGSIDQLMNEFDRRMARRIDIQIRVERLLGEIGGIPEFQEGGTVIARKPTLVQFGEVPEMATFTPLSEVNRVGTGVRDLGVLHIEVNADRYFSQDFEQRVEDSISFFFEQVVQ